MRRTVVNKSVAIKAVVILFAALILLTVYPMRLWPRIITEHGDAQLIGVSDRVNDYHDVVQKFIAQYDRIQSLDVYIEGVEKGQYLTLMIYKPDMTLLYKTIYYLGDKDLPGYINIPLKLDLEVGEVYSARISGCLSTFYVGYSQENKAQYPYYLASTFFGNELVLQNVAMKLNYVQPLSKRMSILVILADIVAAALICVFVNLFYNSRKDKLITVHRAVKYVANPIAAVIIAALMVMVFPMKMFDDRIIDIVFYEVGLIIAGFFIFYAINHENDATLDTKMWHNVLNFLKMSMIAAALWFCCEYMNAFFTIYQKLAERKEMICLLVLLCLMLPREKILRGFNLIYAAIAIIAGAVYRNTHLMAETENEYDLNNAALTYGVVIAILVGFLLIHILMEIYVIVKEKKLTAKLSLVGGIFILLSVALIVFRNTRWWGVVLAVFTLALLFCYSQFETLDERNEKGYMELVIGGVLLNFVVSMIYSWLFRSFAAFNTGRFPFIFHTVTITAEYMTVMVAASMVLLLYKVYETREKKGLKEKFKYMWKEFILFGFVTAYMIFTMSRTAYLSCVVMFLLISVITITDCETKRFKYWISQILVLLFSVIVCFVPAFTLQRILPAIYGHPKMFMIENMNYELNGGGNPSSTLFMGIERFVDLFSEKILSVNLIDYNCPEDKYNYDEDGNPIYGDNGVTLTKKQSLNKHTNLREIVFASETDEETKIYLMETAGLDLNITYEDLGMDYMVSGDDSTEKTSEEAVEEATEEAVDAATEEAVEEVIEDEEVAEAEAPAEEVAEEPAVENEESSTEEENEDISNGRFSIFKSYLSQMNLWGHDEMGAVLENGEVAVHAHNTYIQVMYDNGVIAGILFAMFVLISAVSGGIYYKKNRGVVPGALFAYAMVLCFAVAAVSEWVFQFSNPMTIALILSIVPIAVKKQ